MEVRCPHCQSPIDLASDSPLSAITCPSCGSSFSLLGNDETATYDLAGQRTIGHFELIEPIGSGSFGSVWRARDTDLDRTVAVKIPRKGQLGSSEAELFLREARTAAQLRHPNIVSIYEVGRQEDTVFIVSEYVQGVTLAEWLTAKQMSVREAAGLCAKLAEAVHHAHDAGVVHRDLKPGNIMLDESGEPHIMDFGLARRETGDVTMTVEGRVLGTPAYMSPEQAKGEGHYADRRSDVYSLGVILFELLTGERPFRGSARMLLQQIIQDLPPSPRKLRGTVPRDLETICLKCAEKDPPRRYASAKELAEDLGRFLEGKPIRARPATRLDRAWRWCKRNPVVSVLTTGLIVVLLGGFGGITWQWNRANNAAARAKDEADRYRRLLYVAEMNVAGQAWEENNFSRVEEILRQWEPGSEEEDLRGFEWYYLWRLCERGRGAVTIDRSARARRMAVSPKGDRLAVGYGNGSVRVWDLRSKQELGCFRQPNADLPVSRGAAPFAAPILGWELPCVAFSPDGDSLACPSQDYRRVIVYSIPERKELRRTSSEKGALIRAVGFSPDGQYLATGSNDGAVRLWSTQADAPYPLAGHTGGVLSVAFCPNGKYLASGDDDGSILVWDVTTRKKVNTLTGHTAGVWSVAFATDERFLASGSMDTTVRLWDWPTGSATVLAGHSDEVRSVAFSPDGRFLASGSRDNTAIVWDKATCREIERLKGRSHNVESLAFWSDSGALKLLTGSSDRTVKCWDIGGRKPDVFFEENSGSPIALSPDGRLAATIRLDASRQTDVQNVTLLDLETGAARRISFHGDSEIPPLAMSGRYLAVGMRGGVRLRRLGASGAVGEEESLEPESRAAITAAAFSRDGSLLAAGTSHGGVVAWNLNTRKRLFEQPGGSGRMVTAITFTPCGETVAAGCEDGIVRLWESTTGRRINEIRASSERVYCVAFSHDGEILASGGADGTPRLWRNWSDANYQEDCLVGHSDVISAVMFPPDEYTMITASHDCTLRVWDLRERRVRLSLKEHRSIDSADFAATGLCVASWSRDGSIRIWRAATKEEVQRTLSWHGAAKK